MFWIFFSVDGKCMCTFLAYFCSTARRAGCILPHEPPSVDGSHEDLYFLQLVMSTGVDVLNVRFGKSIAQQMNSYALFVFIY